MRHMCNQPRFRRRATTFLIITATMATAVLLMSPGGLEAANPALEAHDANQTQQHQNLSGQGTTHDSAQTSQHNTLSQKIDNLSTSADHSGLPPTWDKTLPANDPGGACPSNSSRYTCVMGGVAVRDNETGLVWEQSPLTTTHDWNLARFQCANRTVGGRKGWRLPSVHELASLVDPNNPGGNPDLPPGHPFSNVQSSFFYWSATTVADGPNLAWLVVFDSGGVGATLKTDAFHVWCVRGAMNADQY